MVVCFFYFKLFFSTKYSPTPFHNVVASHHVFSQQEENVQIPLLSDPHVFALLSCENSFKNRMDSFPLQNIKTIVTVWSSKENYRWKAVWMPACVLVVITAVSAVKHIQQFSFDAILSFLSFIYSEGWTGKKWGVRLRLQKLKLFIMLKKIKFFVRWFESPGYQMASTSSSLWAFYIT